MKLNGFDQIAPVYDLLAKTIFGSSIRKSQIYFLNRIPAHSNVLILGGGSGWILNELCKVQSTCKVWYIDASAKMITLAKRKVLKEKGINFIHGTEDALPASIMFDAVITNFYLDMFSNDQLNPIVEKIHHSITLDSIWIATDFVAGNELWKRMMLKMMYAFFRLTCKIESSQLPDWSKAIAQRKIKETEFQFFFRGFIKTSLYR